MKSCVICGQSTYRNQWYKGRCKKCYNRLILNPKWHPITHKKWNPIWNPNDILFKGKSIHLKENPRKGVCSKCHRKVGQGIKRTNMHHLQYHDDDPLKDTIELCVSCHVKIHSSV